MNFIRIKWGLFITALLFASAVFSQGHEFNGWSFWSHRNKLSGKWSLATDVQFRSAEKWDYLKTLLLRPSVEYEFRKDQTASLGYAYFVNWEKEDGKKTVEPEHRVWEQYNLEKDLGRTKLTNRFRLEQRFLEGEEGGAFAQRFRYYARAAIPLRRDSVFKKGVYIPVQNEIFLNVQGKEKVNDRFFDQNRVYTGVGYRFSEKVEVEIGYLFRYQIEKDSYLRNHVLQLQLSTNL